METEIFAHGNVENQTRETTTKPIPDGRPPASRCRFMLFAPLASFVGLAGMLGWGLTHNAKVIPSALIGRAVPEFSLPPVRGRNAGLSTTDLQGEVSLVNVFASWCTACREEHPVFMEFNRVSALPIHGINYKDRPQDAVNWLDTLGDPYTRTGADRNGRVSIDWGVYGVPETFIIDRSGVIAFKHVGAVTPGIYREIFSPIIAELRQ